MTAAGASLTDGLNEEQQTAVFAPADRPLRIVAGAGTGKTETLARRVAHLVRNLGVPPDQILVLTFSNKAARELRERLSRDHILGAASAKRVCARTFHGFALALLRTHAAAAGLGDARFSVLGDSQQIALMRECVAENDASCAAAREAARTAARARHAGSFAVLGVAPDASTAQIRRAYYQRARLCHPDKHPGDAAKESEFKELSEAYQTLFDEERRSAYDVHGRAGSDGMYTDPRQVFAAVFGGPEFVPWVGTLGEVPDEVQAAQQLADAALQAVAVKRKEVQELQASPVKGCQPATAWVLLQWGI